MAIESSQPPAPQGVESETDQPDDLELLAEEILGRLAMVIGQGGMLMFTRKAADHMRLAVAATVKRNGWRKAVPEGEGERPRMPPAVEVAYQDMAKARESERAELAGYKQVVQKSWALARDFIAERVEKDPAIAVDIDFLVGRMLREITVLESKLAAQERELAELRGRVNPPG